MPNISEHSLSILSPTKIRSLFESARDIALSDPNLPKYSLWRTHPLPVLIDAYFARFENDSNISAALLSETINGESNAPRNPKSLELRSSIVHSIYKSRVSAMVDDESIRNALIGELNLGLSRKEIQTRELELLNSIGSVASKLKYLDWLGNKPKIEGKFNQNYRIINIHLGMTGIESFSKSHDFAKAVSPNISMIASIVAMNHTKLHKQAVSEIPGVRDYACGAEIVSYDDAQPESKDGEKLDFDFADPSLIDADARVDLLDHCRAKLFDISFNSMRDDLSQYQFQNSLISKQELVNGISEILTKMDGDSTLIDYAGHVSKKIDARISAQELIRKINAVTAAATVDMLDLFVAEAADLEVEIAKFDSDILRHFDKPMTAMSNRLDALEAEHAATTSFADFDTGDSDETIESFPDMTPSNPFHAPQPTTSTLYMMHGKHHSSESAFRSDRAPTASFGDHLVRLVRPDRPPPPRRIHPYAHNVSFRSDADMLSSCFHRPSGLRAYDGPLARLVALPPDPETLAARRSGGSNLRRDRGFVAGRLPIQRRLDKGAGGTVETERITDPGGTFSGRFIHAAYHDDGPRTDLPDRYDKGAVQVQRLARQTSNGYQRMTATNRPNLNDIESWAQTERTEDDIGSNRRTMMNTIISQIEHDKSLPQPDALPFGSPDRLVAEARQRRIGTLAATLGYVPPAQEVATEIVKHAVLEHIPIKPLERVAIEAGSGDDGGGDSGKKYRAKRRQSPDRGQDLGGGGREIGFDS